MAKLTGRCYSPRQFFLYSSFSSPVRPCIFFLECPVFGAVAAEDGALELLLLETTEMVATPVRTLVYYDAGRSSCLQPSFLLLALFFLLFCFSLSSTCSSSPPLFSFASVFSGGGGNLVQPESRLALVWSTGGDEDDGEALSV